MDTGGWDQFPPVSHSANISHTLLLLESVSTSATVVVVVVGFAGVVVVVGGTVVVVGATVVVVVGGSVTVVVGKTVVVVVEVVVVETIPVVLLASSSIGMSATIHKYVNTNARHDRNSLLLCSSVMYSFKIEIRVMVLCGESLS